MFPRLLALACATALSTTGIAAAQAPSAAAKPPSNAATHTTSVVKPRPATRRAPPHPAAPPPAPAPTPTPEPERPPEPTKGSNSNLPLPRFATLRSEEVNMRSGPGTRYPIEWVYKRRDLPVEVTREFDVWRLVQDQEGVKGWVNQAVLAPRRTGVVINAEQDLRASASDTADSVARLKPGVIVRLRSCDVNSEWCQASVGDYRGYIRRSAIWGLLPNEAVQ